MSIPEFFLLQFLGLSLFPGFLKRIAQGFNKLTHGGSPEPKGHASEAAAAAPLATGAAAGIAGAAATGHAGSPTAGVSCVGAVLFISTRVRAQVCVGHVMTVTVGYILLRKGGLDKRGWAGGGRSCFDCQAPWVYPGHPGCTLAGV